MLIPTIQDMANLMDPIYAQMKAWYLNITTENKLWLPFAQILKWQLCLGKWNVICKLFYRHWRIMVARHRELKIKWFIQQQNYRNCDRPREVNESIPAAS